MARVIRGAEVRSARVMDAADEATRILERARQAAAAERESMRAELREQATGEANARLAASHIALEAKYRAEHESLRAEVTTLALAVAEKVISSEAKTRPELIAEWVDEALSRVARASSVTVRVHPDDVDRLAIPHASVEADPSLAPGDCVVDSELGVIDGRLAMKIEALRNALGAGT